MGALPVHTAGHPASQGEAVVLANVSFQKAPGHLMQADTPNLHRPNSTLQAQRKRHFLTLL